MKIPCEDPRPQADPLLPSFLILAGLILAGLILCHPTFPLAARDKTFIMHSFIMSSFIMSSFIMSSFIMGPDSCPGRRLTFQTRNEWCELLLASRCNECESQLRAVRSGMAQLVPVAALCLFTAEEIERLVCGEDDWTPEQ